MYDVYAAVTTVDTYAATLVISTAVPSVSVTEIRSKTRLYLQEGTGLVAADAGCTS